MILSLLEGYGWVWMYCSMAKWQKRKRLKRSYIVEILEFILWIKKINEIPFDSNVGATFSLYPHKAAAEMRPS